MRLYYGWFVLAAAAVTELLAQGATSYAAGLFVLPLQAEFHISRANANSSVLILFLGAALASPLVGKALDRLPIRLIVSAGAILFCGALAFIARTPSLAAMAVALFVPAAIGFMCIGPLTTSTLAARWFHRHRGLALGIAAVATSAGGIVVVPLLARAIQAWGWRQGLLVEAAVIAFVILALTWLFLRDSPAAMGLADHPENQGPDDALATDPAVHQRAIFISRAFWIPSLVAAGVSGTSQATVVTLVPYGVQLGATPVFAALLVSGFAICAAATKILAGVLADRIDKQFILIAAAVFMTLSWLSVALVASFAVLLAAACLAGVALGCMLPAVSALIAASFGPARFGSVMGWTYTLTLVMALVAVRFVGAMYDRFGDYHAAFLSFAALMACLALLAVLMGPRQHA